MDRLQLQLGRTPLAHTLQPNRCVVLDTNAYRRLARGRLPAQARTKGIGIRAHDQRQNVQALAHPLVIVELLAHLSDLTDPARDDCRASVIALWEHCATDLGGRRQLAILEDPEAQLAVALYGRCPIPNHRFVENLAHTARLVGETDEPDVLMQLQDTLTSCADTVNSIEKRFVDDMMRFVVRGFDPKAENWDAIKQRPDLLDTVLTYLDSEGALVDLARANVRLARVIADEDVLTPVTDDEIQRVLQAFACHLELYRRITRKIVATGCDVSKRKNRNWIWDLQIAFALGGYSVRSGLGIDLVTGDQDIAEAGRAAGFANRVLTFDDYSARLRN